MKTKQEILTPEANLAVFKPFEAQITALEEENNSVVFDYHTKKGQEEARSHIHKIRKSRAAVEKKRKEIKADILEAGRLVDERATQIKDKLEEMIQVHLIPVEEAEAFEKQRIEKLEKRIDAIGGMTDTVGCSALEIKNRIEELEATQFSKEEFGELEIKALTQKKLALDKLQVLYDAQDRAEKQEAELEKLREQQRQREEKERKEREDREKKEAEERRQREAEEHRKESIRKDIQRIRDYGPESAHKSIAIIQSMIDGLDSTIIREDDFQEFYQEATETKQIAIETMQRNLDAQARLEEQEAENRKLREEQQKKDRELREANEAKEKAESEAREQREAEEQRKRKSEAEEKARQEAEAKAKRRRKTITRDIEEFYLKHLSHDTPEECADAVAAAIFDGIMPHTKLDYRG